MVAIVESTVVGMVLAYRLARIDRAHSMMYLHEIDVLPSHQRRGIGTALIAEIKRICRAEGMTKLWLATHESNTAAIRLYTHTGGRLSNDSIGFMWNLGDSYHE